MADATARSLLHLAEVTGITSASSKWMIGIRIPIAALSGSIAESSNRYSVARTTVPVDQWPKIVVRHAEGESYRRIASDYGVSYETIRSIIRKKRPTDEIKPESP